MSLCCYGAGRVSRQELGFCINLLIHFFTLLKVIALKTASNPFFTLLRIAIFLSSTSHSVFLQPVITVSFYINGVLDLWLYSEEKWFISASVLTCEVKTSASLVQHASLCLSCITMAKGWYGWTVLIRLGVKACSMGIHSQDAVIVQSWSGCSLSSFYVWRVVGSEVGASSYLIGKMWFLYRSDSVTSF